MSYESRYCKACCKIVPYLLLKSDKYETLPGEIIAYHDNIRALDLSAEEGCKLCRLMRQRILLLADNPANLRSCEHPITLSMNKREGLISRVRFELGCQERCHWRWAKQEGILSWYDIEVAVDNEPYESSDESEESENEKPWITADMVTTDASGEVMISTKCLPSLEELCNRKNTKRYMRSIRFLTEQEDNRDIKGACVPGAHGASKISIDQAKRWLRECDISHNLCGTLRMSKFCEGGEPEIDFHDSCPLLSRDFYHPKRLLFIQTDGDFLTVAMVDAETPEFVATFVSKDGRYACLSYRWGVQTHDMGLTHRNAKEKRCKTPIDLLPGTFADAIRICKSLEISYIWIDAFCIEQPSEDGQGDWAEQSCQMDQIYGNAYFTLAASGSNNVHEGLLFERPAVRWPLETCHLTLDGCPDVGDGRVRHNSASLVPVTVPWRQSVGTAPLQMRGWVVQERMLSARILHWSRNALSWECRQLNSLDICKLTEFGTEELWRGKTWCDIMQTFSKTEFTNKGDRLLGISGIVNQFQKLAPDKYLAGHWEKDLFKTLLWRVQTPVGTSKSKNIPTWSWASINTSIRFTNFVCMPNELDLADVSLVGTNFEQADANPYGNLLRGNLRLRGDLAVLRASVPDWKGDDLLYSGGIHLWPDLADDRRRILAGEETIIVCLRLFEMKPYFFAKHKYPDVYGAFKEEHARDESLMLRHTGRPNEYIHIGALTAYFYADEELLVPIGEGEVDLI